MWQRRLPFVKEHMKDQIENKIKNGLPPGLAKTEQEAYLLKIISSFLTEKVEDRIDLRHIENIYTEENPLFQRLKEKVFEFYDIQKNQM